MEYWAQDEDNQLRDKKNIAGSPLSFYGPYMGALTYMTLLDCVCYTRLVLKHCILQGRGRGGSASKPHPTRPHPQKVKGRWCQSSPCMYYVVV
jgi:hypothetical protein